MEDASVFKATHGLVRQLVAARQIDGLRYVYTRLVSLNDVGCDPRAFGASPSAFHHAMSRRLSSTPHAMVTTSTHDSKRSEDVRARIDVLSEVPGHWR